METLDIQCSKPGQHELLIRVAATIIDVHEREAKMERFVEPIAEQVELLKKFRLAPPDEVMDSDHVLLFTALSRSLSLDVVFIFTFLAYDVAVSAG